KVRTAAGWEPAPQLLPRQDRKAREYLWNLEPYVGQTLGIALIDEDRRPGCHLFCSGFRLQGAELLAGREFMRFMVRLTRDHQLPEVARFDSKHFLAVSNADDAFTGMRLRNCELIYALFYEHFRAKGFRLHEPPGKLMVAIFDSQAGLDAYVGQKVSAGLTGVYHPPTNRLVVYDFGQNSAFVASKR